jgi:hypothetical protein
MHSKPMPNPPCLSEYYTFCFMNLFRARAQYCENMDQDDSTNRSTASLEDPRKVERKRQRERQRRSDLASAFDELQQLLATVSPDVTYSKNQSIRNSYSMDTNDQGSTRVDLIVQSIDCIRALQFQNDLLKRRMQDYNMAKHQQQQPRDSKTDEEQEVLVIVPTLTPVPPHFYPLQQPTGYSANAAYMPYPQPPPRYGGPQEPPLPAQPYSSRTAGSPVKD